jgi:serine/threonine protein kinase
MLINEREALMIVVQIVKGLRALHKKKIIHRDLKVSILLGHDIVCKYLSNQLEVCQNWRHEYGQSPKGSVWQDSSWYTFLCGT